MPDQPLPLPDFRVLFESAPGLYLVLTPDFRIAAVSDAYLLATMTTREGILGRGLFEVFPDNPHDPQATGERNLRASLERALATGMADTMAVQKYDIRRPGGEGGEFEVRYWSPRNSPVLGADGAVQYIIHRVEDVTSFVRLQQAGVERERMTEELQLRAVRMESEIYQRAQELAEANRRLQRANDEQARLYNRIALLMAQAGDELRAKSQPGEQWDVLSNPIPPEQMLSRIGKLINDSRQLEEQLLQSQKMEAIGRLAGGIAHDFNNLLTVITGYASLTEVEDGPARHNLREIDRAATRAAALTAQLLAFSRKQVRQVRILDVNQVVRGIEDMARRLIGENLRFETRLDPNPAMVRADKGQIEQVIMNLVVNARDAMPSGGEVTVATSAADVAPDEIHGLPGGNYIVLRVSDTGQGMDAETARRIFEPFFTTKQPGKGTGLGLATVYGIAEQSGGAVTVESAPGEGAVFRVFLPAVEGAVVVEDRGLPAPAVHSRRGAILVVEDEEPLRRLIRTLLEGAGYRVLEAASGESALTAAANYTGRLDLLLTDVVMSGMTGPGLARRLSGVRKNMEVVYMSGYDRELLEPDQSAAPYHFLPKPFTRQALLDCVAEVLARVGRTR